MVCAVAAFLALFLSDNLLWFSTFADPAVQKQSFALAPPEKHVLDWLSQHAAPPAYVVSANQNINYLTSTYTNLRAWRGHYFNTPQVRRRQAEIKAAFATGTPIPTSNPVLYIVFLRQHWTPPAGAVLQYSNRVYEVWLR
jgi:hypothetical protein